MYNNKLQMSDEKIDVPTDISLTRKFQDIIKNNDTEGLLSLLSEKSPNVKSTRGGFRTPLTFACYYSRGEIVQILLNYGANPDILDPDDQSCLVNYLTTRHLIPERDIPVISNILDRSPHLINLKSQRGLTPLYQAIAYDAPVEIVHLLLNRGADVNQQGPDGSVILTAVNNIVLSLKEVESTLRDRRNYDININQQNVFPNSKQNLIHLMRNPNIIIPDLPLSVKRNYPQIVSLFNKMYRERYRNEIVEKGKKAAILREMFDDDTMSEILKFLKPKRKSVKNKKKSSKKGKSVKKKVKKSVKKNVKKSLSKKK